METMLVNMSLIWDVRNTPKISCRKTLFWIMKSIDLKFICTRMEKLTLNLHRGSCLPSFDILMGFIITIIDVDVDHILVCAFALHLNNVQILLLTSSSCLI